MNALQQININDFILVPLENGDFLLQRKNIVTYEQLSNYDLSFSTITNCIINGTISTKNNYSSILREIYLMIGSGTRIILNTILKIETGKITNCGFRYLQELGISVQGVDSNKRTQEILNQCLKNNITIEMYVTLQNGSNIIIRA
jgi:hypothetical protein